MKCKADVENVIQRGNVTNSAHGIYTEDLSVDLYVNDEIAQYPEMEDTILYSENDEIYESFEANIDDDEEDYANAAAYNDEDNVNPFPNNKFWTLPS